MAVKSVDDQEIVYEEFEPFCKWQRKEEFDVLEIHLQDFKKEQLKVQLSNHGVLKISGERQIDATKRSKFYKEVDAPNTKYDTHAIHPRFVNNNLIITLPKLKPSPPEAASEPSKLDQPSKSAAGSCCGGAREKKAPAPAPHLGGNALTAAGQCQMQPCRKRPLAMGSRVAKMAASLAVTAGAVLLLAAYVHCMYKSTVDHD